MKKLSALFTAATMLFAVSNAAKADDDTVYLYTWTEYVPSGLLDNFTKETGIKVIVSSLESNETMYARLKTLGKNGGYDVIAPSNYFVSKMRKEGMLLPLDHSKLPVLKELDPNLLNKPYDPNNEYSLPQILGAPGIAYNSDVVDAEKITSWGDLWNPEYKDKLQLLDDAREIFNLALLKLGEDPNTTDPEVIKKAYEELLKLRPNVLAFSSDNPANAFVAGEVDLGMLWNGSAYIARKDGAPINLLWPKEGPVLWVDTLAIPTTAQNPDGAHKLINYLLSAEVAKELALEIGYPTPNLEAQKLLPPEMVNDSSLYPPAEILQKSHWQDDVGDAAIIYENYYQQLKVAK
ncbi:spermidine/putrescine transport system substrate-binding protein [Pasteurella testudinis DSM 23072]|uniref:Putrescine-binding periplasmic protein n=1 Tax=Pasteurella testudinis DSM 23072 TaxID=1122938 RepID=A0A1W1V6I0_9PAST|nr:extracellular solute-binding protein [Pasteurella testudinis]SMB88988.1 spermidine/putrescine transport system substrate-binding protein [Pasteurella testudinis DSM 23072]SUB50238.1 protein PotD [Pasteurella testudinis]